MTLPENNQTVMPYLILQNASGFINFLEKVFDGKEVLKYMRDENNVMHAEIMIGKDSTIMVADATAEFPVSNSNLFIYVENADETCRKGIEQGGTMIREIADQEYGRSGGMKDPFGNTWWVTTPLTQ